MDNAIVGRSPQDIYDDALCEMHTLLCRDLSLVCNGVFVYRGEKAKELSALRNEVERAINGEIVLDTFWTWKRIVWAVRP